MNSRRFMIETKEGNLKALRWGNNAAGFACGDLVGSRTSPAKVQVVTCDACGRDYDLIAQERRGLVRAGPGSRCSTS